MIQHQATKQLLVVIAAASAGFYVGGRYVGGLAIQEYFGTKPGWVSTAQETLTVTLILSSVCVGLWIVWDYMEHRQ